MGLPARPSVKAITGRSRTHQPRSIPSSGTGLRYTSLCTSTHAEHKDGSTNCHVCCVSIPDSSRVKRSKGPYIGIFECFSREADACCVPVSGSHRATPACDDAFRVPQPASGQRAGCQSARSICPTGYVLSISPVNLRCSKIL